MFGLNKGGQLFDKQTLNKLRSKKSSDQQSALAAIDKRFEGTDNAKIAHELAMAAQKGDDSALIDLMQRGNKEATVASVADTSKKDFLDSNRVGKKGTLEGVQDELVTQTIVLKEIRDSASYGGGGVNQPETGTDNPQDESNMSSTKGKKQ